MADTILPKWLIDQVKRNKTELYGGTCARTKNDIHSRSLHTVCEEALCPNRGKCFGEGDATFLILGDICTRGCRFCAVKRGAPLPPDEGEISAIADVCRKWKLKYAVITSPTRDDLSDGGAAHFAKTITALNGILVEPLVPDFAGNIKSLETVLSAKPAVFAHNIETVLRLYKTARRGADYARSLEVLSNSKKISSGTPTKSAIMLGLGETKNEVMETMKDLRRHNCDILVLGQYLSPSKQHLPVERYLEPQEFDDHKKTALNLGFKAVLSEPLARSSYLAGSLYKEFLRNQNTGD